MFDQLSDRVATALVTGLDIAVEFATLGEYRLAVPAEQQAAPIAPPRPARGRQVFDGSSLFVPGPGAGLPRPATAAVRDETPATPAVLAICSEARTRSKKAHPETLRPRTRTRGGAVKAPEQLCLWP